MKVLFLVNIPAPYRVAFFNELSKHCQLTVLIEESKASHRTNEWLTRIDICFEAIFLKPCTIGKYNICFDVRKHLSKEYDIIIIGVYNTPTSMYAMHYMKSHKIPFTISIDGGYVKQESKLHRLYKQHLISMAESWLSPSKKSDDYLLYYGARKEDIYRYYFTSLSQKEMNENAARGDKEELRKRLGINESKVVLSIGRFSYQKGYGKGYDTLMRASEKLSKSIGIYILGDEPTEEFKVWKQEKMLSHVHFIGFQNKATVSEYYKAADVFVLLTRGDVWGLVINEAMSNYLPIITTDKCMAGLELVSDGINGFIVSADDASETVTCVNQLFDNDDIELFGVKSRTAIEDHTIEKMVKQHISIFGEIVNDRIK